MSREVFNLIWVPGRKGNTIEIGAAVDHVDCVAHKAKDAVILYPSLFTPAVYMDGWHKEPFFEILIASKETLTAQDVNAHLKISAGLDPEKTYDSRTLFAKVDASTIVVEDTKADGNGILSTQSRFEGILAAQVVDLYQPYSHRYKVKIAASAIRRDQPQQPQKLSSRKTVGGLEDAIVGEEPQDVSIAKFLANAGGHGGAPGPIPGNRCYGFKIKDDGSPDLEHANPNEPIQSYHPLFVWTQEMPAANFGHVSDIHLNSRLDILRRSPAYVVEDPKLHPDAGGKLSGTVGQKLVDTNGSFASVLGKMRANPEVHGLAVGGDLIDHIRNAYQRDLFSDPAAADKRVDKIWKAVDLGDKDRNTRYPAGIDYLVFYSMMVDFCRRGQKPLFGISGNHDAYEEPFGISPRALGVRANAGIPADLNLTFYEALLAFGPTWNNVVKSLNFNKDWWVWFYQVFGAFNDFVIRLPVQAVVGLGWGSQEDMFLDEQGLSHLPRADDAVTDAQLALLNRAIAQPVVMFTHFTLLSFDDPIPMQTARGSEQTGTLGVDLDDFNAGTFETNRAAVIDLIRKKRLQLIISGHSHRRGTYQLNEPEMVPVLVVDPMSGTSTTVNVEVQKVTMHDTETVGTKVSGFLPPVIAVSDSAGPMPRLNVRNELKQWGSDKASGTLATFGADGKLTKMEIVRAERPQPRIAVALDYFDIELENLFAADVSTETFWLKDESAAVEAGKVFYTLNLSLAPAFVSGALASVSTFTLHAATEKEKETETDTKKLKWLQVTLQPADASGSKWFVPADQTKIFYELSNAAHECFIGLVFRSGDDVLSKHYNWDDPWYLEVTVKPTLMMAGPMGAMCQYTFSRPSRLATGGAGNTSWHFREIPDFDWRREQMKDKYGG